MKIYSDFSLARVGQVALDLLALIAIALSIWAGVAVRDGIVALADVGKQLEKAGSGFRKTMSDAAHTLSGIPLIGRSAGDPFRSASDAGGTLADAGQSEQVVIAHLATVLGIVVALVPMYFVVRYLLVRRWRFARAATTAASTARASGGLDLLAFRALAHCDPRDLVALGPTTVDLWRTGDRSTIEALASLELRAAGVRLGR
jgi:hypothetical protein